MKHVIFVTREAGDMPAVRVRCQGFSRQLAQAGIRSQVLSFADTWGAASGSRESLLRGRDKIRYNVQALLRLWPADAVVVMQRVHYHSFGPLLAQALRRRPLILDLDDWEAREDCSYQWGWYPRSKAEWLMRTIARQSCCCVAASRFLYDYLKTWNPQVLYVPTGVDVQHFKPGATAPIAGPVTLSWAGTFHRPDNVENIGWLLKIFCKLRARYPDIRLEIRGDGRYGDEVRKQIERCACPEVSLLAWIAAQEMPAYLERVHIGVMPLLQDSNFNRAKSPTRLFEYMAMAKPTVSSDIGEPRHIVQDGKNGLLADTKEEFIEKMALLINDKRLRNEIGHNARITIDNHYSLSLLGKQLYEILSKL